jgi:hypothetical protein
MGGGFRDGLPVGVELAKIVRKHCQKYGTFIRMQIPDATARQNEASGYN